MKKRELNVDDLLAVFNEMKSEYQEIHRPDGIVEVKTKTCFLPEWAYNRKS
jgi:hypothetical protein